jgi:hypothetical protein
VSHAVDNLLAALALAADQDAKGRG